MSSRRPFAACAPLSHPAARPPEDTGFENAQQAILIERYTTGNFCVRDSTVTYMPVISGELVLGTPL